MKIFYFSTTLLPSHDPQSIHVMKMAQAFAKNKHDVTLFARLVGRVSSEELFQIYDTEPCFKLHLSSSFGVPVVSDTTQFFKLKKALPTLGGTDLFYGDDLYALCALGDSHTPIVFEVQDIPRSPLAASAMKKLLARPNLRAIVTISDVLKKEFMRLYPTLQPEQIFVAHDGADLIDYISQKAQTLKTLKGREECFNIGYAGSLHPGKGLALIARLAKFRPNYDFHILGGTVKEVQRYQTQIQPPNIHFYGHCDHADVPSYLKAFDVCIAPYQHRALIKTGRNTSRWISPMKIFEYMAAGKPILCSNLPIMHEILEHGNNALLLPASDEEKWGYAIDNIKNNPETWAKLGEQAYQSLQDRYTWDKRAQAILDFSLSDTSPVRFSNAAS